MHDGEHPIDTENAVAAAIDAADEPPTGRNAPLRVTM
jgi:hypothetical protein